MRPHGSFQGDRRSRKQSHGNRKGIGVCKYRQHGITTMMAGGALAQHGWFVMLQKASILVYGGRKVYYYYAPARPFES